MDHKNKSQNTAENELIKSVDSTISSAGMDPKELPEENRKLEAETQENKKANPNQFGGTSTKQMNSKTGEELEKIEEEMDGLDLDQQKEVGKLVEENNGLAQDDDDQEEGIYIPNWVIEMLEWIKRIEMADSALSYSSLTFQRLCWPKLHENVKPHMVESVNLTGKKLPKENEPAADEENEDEEKPIPNVPPPDYILGFNWIHMRFMHDRDLEFIKCIAPKLKDIALMVKDEWGLDEERIETFKGVLNLWANKTTSLMFDKIGSIDIFNRCMPGFLDPIEAIFLYDIPSTLFDNAPLFKWLTNPQIDGANKKKLWLMYDVQSNQVFPFIERIKQEFVNAASPFDFQIGFRQVWTPWDFVAADVEFELENEHTGRMFRGLLREVMLRGHRMQYLVLICGQKPEENGNNEESKSKNEEEKKSAEDNSTTIVLASPKKENI